MTSRGAGATLTPLPLVAIRSKLRALVTDHRAWLALALGALWAPALQGSSLWLGDAMTRAYPLRLEARRRLLAGELPAWSETLGVGGPVLTRGDAGVFDPMLALALPLPPPLGLDLAALAYHLLFALGVHRWLRTLGAEDDDAGAGATLAALSGYVVSVHFSAPATAWSLAWAPWALHHLAGAGRRAPRQRAVACAALCLAMTALCGDATSGLIAALVGLAQALGAPSPPARRAALADLAAAVGLGFAVAAVQALPSLAAQHAPPPPPALPARRLIELFAPGFFGEPFSHRWFVHGLYRSTQPWAAGIHLGAVAVPLALLASLRRDRTRQDLTLGALTALALLLALVPVAPSWLVPRPEKLLGAVVLGVAALAARGLPAARARLERAAGVTGAMSVAMLLLSTAMFFRGARLARRFVGGIAVFPQEVADVVLTAASHGAAWLLGYHAVALLALRGRLPMHRARLALGALLVAELGINALPLAGWAPSTIYRDPSALAPALRRAAAPESPARVLRFLDHALPTELSDAVGQAATLRPNLGMDQGVAHVDPSATDPTLREVTMRRMARKFPTRTLRLFGARHMSTSRAVFDALHLPLRPIAAIADGRWLLLEDPAAEPVAYVPARVVAPADISQAFAMTFAEGFRPGVDAAIEGAPARAAQGRCAVQRPSPEAVTLRCEASAPAYAVLADPWDPGWRATVDGRAVTILRANVLFRAVPIPAGRSVVTMRYTAPWQGAGAAMSAFGLCAAALLLRRRRVIAAAR